MLVDATAKDYANFIFKNLFIKDEHFTTGNCCWPEIVGGFGRLLRRLKATVQLNAPQLPHYYYYNGDSSLIVIVIVIIMIICLFIAIIIIIISNIVIHIGNVIVRVFKSANLCNPEPPEADRRRLESPAAAVAGKRSVFKKKKKCQITKR